MMEKGTRKLAWSRRGMVGVLRTIALKRQLVLWMQDSLDGSRLQEKS